MINLGGPIAVQECKTGASCTAIVFSDGFKETAEWSARMFRSDEGAEGMASFREKRKPSWVRSSASPTLKEGTMTDVIRIGNCSGFYGDRLASTRDARWRSY